jgi:LemA protein
MIGFLVLLAVVVIWCVAVYNRLVTLRNRIANAFGQIDVQLKRRYDLVPNLVEVARAYLKHESATLEAVI